jgi:hypothetical protein
MTFDEVYEIVEFKVHMPATSWFGLSLGRATMDNVDMIIF